MDFFLDIFYCLYNNIRSRKKQRKLFLKVAKRYGGAPYRFGGGTVWRFDWSECVRKMYDIFQVQLPGVHTAESLMRNFIDVISKGRRN